MKRWLLVGLLLATPASAQDLCQQVALPLRAVQVMDGLYDPVLANGDDEARRQLTRRIVEQLVFDLPAESWVWKSADPGRPPSKDAFGRLVLGRLCIWDWQNGTTRRRAVDVGHPAKDAPGQNPIVLVGVNHLGAPGPAPQPVPQPVPIPPVIDLTEVYRYVAQVEARASAERERMYQDLKAEFQAVHTEVRSVDVKLETHDTRVNMFIAALKDWRTYAVAAAGVAGWFGRDAAK